MCGLEDRAAWLAPPLNRVVSVRDGRSGKAVPFDTFLDALADADVVFLGESHNDETTHRVELAIYEGLLERRGGGVVLAMEMFERDVQQSLDSYLAGEIDEATFLDRVHPWSQYRTAYRPLIEKARACGRPVVASNFPRSLRRRVAMEGPEVLETLEGSDKRQAPAEFFPNTKGYWRRMDNAVRSHRAMMGGGGGGDDQRLYSTQSLWDNAMGEACATALDEHPGDLVLHVNGGFHSAYWDGTVRQFSLRKPTARVATVDITPVMNPAVANVEGAPCADYVVFVEMRATDLNDGTWSVYVPRELEYLFQLPGDASGKAPVPFLIWLSDDGFTASEGLDLWKDRLGDDTAIAVIEAPYRQVAADLGGGGRWFWADTFSSDVGSLVMTVERVWAYLLRHYPIDETRVCLAGEGTGATVVAAVALLTDRMGIEAVALSPRQYAKIKDFPLPLPEFLGDDTPPTKSLRILGGEDDKAWWAEELGEYCEIGMHSEMVLATADPWRTELEAENVLRAALGLDAHPAPTTTMRRHILVDSDSPRARRWARLGAIRSTAKDGVPVAVLDAPPADRASGLIPTDIRPEAFAEAHALPPCPGPFGGTTVVVVLDSATSRDREAWLTLQDEDPLSKRSRFHRLRIATVDGERNLPDVLSGLFDAGRKNVLIVPATFCADTALMQKLERSVREWGDRMTLHWLPGLGGRKATLTIQDSDSPVTKPGANE
ncbi:MAG: ChaN family lipoprotein [Phycisphaerae bacterium]|nr:ChaN family lipoprotein [Phycisphaerae bacterium]